MPDCGLDGHVMFDYGLRRFTLALGNYHRPLVCEAGGGCAQACHTGSLARAPSLVALARSLWQTQKQQLSLMSRTQPPARAGDARPAPLVARRVQQAYHETFADGRAGSSPVWAGYDAAGGLLEGFCLADDRSPMSEAYTPVALERYAAIGLPHPVDIDHERRLLGRAAHGSARQRLQAGRWSTDLLKR